MVKPPIAKGTNWKLLSNREELFLRYFKWRTSVHDLDHSHYCRTLTADMTNNQKTWFSFLFGMTYRTPQAYAYWATFPDFEKIDQDDLIEWHADNWKRTSYGTDARYNKGHFPKQVASLREWAGKFSLYSKVKSLTNTTSRKENFERLFSSICSIYKYGRMTGWITCQCLHDTLDLDIDFDNVLIRNPNSDSSMQSIWNGYCILRGHYQMLLGKSYATANYKVTEEDYNHVSTEIMKMRERACDYTGAEVDVFKWESVWCQFKRLFNEKESKEYPGHSCFPGETKISLVNGTEVEIKDLVGKKDFWVYSCAKDGTLAVGRGHSARKMKEVEQLCVVHLDNGTQVKCTTDHRFLTRQGTYVEAKDLRKGQSLMPLYRGVTPEGYRWAKDNKTRSKVLVYQLVANTHNLEQKKKADKRRTLIGHQLLAIHHKDENKLNDCPENLEWISAGEHLDIHREKFQKTEEGKSLMKMLGEKTGSSNITKRNKSEKARTRSSEIIKNLHERKDFSERLKKRSRDTMNQLWKDPGFVEKRKEISGKQISKINKDPEVRKKQQRSAIVKSAIHVLSLGLVLNEENYNNNRLAHSVCKYNKALDLFGSEEELYAACQENHKVVKVEIIQCPKTAVYDFKVDDYNNFALSSGCFVHNSGDATSRYMYYKEHWPEVNWFLFREALLSQPGIIKGQTYRREWNKVFGETGLLLNMHEMYNDMPDAYDVLCIDPNDNLVRDLFIDHHHPIPVL